MPPSIRIKRVYAEPSEDDGCRVLVDRLWPRGLKKEDLQFDEWLKEIAPSTELRKWIHADSGRWDEFCQRYNDELAANADAIERVRSLLAEGTVTLLYAARDESRNHAAVLRDWLIASSR